jgi:hypothetical protein
VIWSRYYLRGISEGSMALRLATPSKIPNCAEITSFGPSSVCDFYDDVSLLPCDESACS